MSNDPPPPRSLNDLIEGLLARAATARANNDPHGAIQVYLRLIPLQDRLYTSYSVEAATSFNNMAEAFLQQGQYTAADEGLSKALEVREDAQFGGMGLGTRYDAAVSRENMAKVREGQGKLLDARELRLRGQAKDTMICSHSEVEKMRFSPLRSCDLT